jgi:hypothetical protein
MRGSTAQWQSQPPPDRNEGRSQKTAGIESEPKTSRGNSTESTVPIAGVQLREIFVTATGHPESG